MQFEAFKAFKSKVYQVSRVWPVACTVDTMLMLLVPFYTESQHVARASDPVPLILHS